MGLGLAHPISARGLMSGRLDLSSSLPCTVEWSEITSNLHCDDVIRFDRRDFDRKSPRGLNCELGRAAFIRIPVVPLASLLLLLASLTSPSSNGRLHPIDFLRPSNSNNGCNSEKSISSSVSTSDQHLNIFLTYEWELRKRYGSNAKRVSVTWSSSNQSDCGDNSHSYVKNIFRCWSEVETEEEIDFSELQPLFELEGRKKSIGCKRPLDDGEVSEASRSRSEASGTTGIRMKAARPSSQFNPRGDLRSKSRRSKRMTSSQCKLDVISDHSTVHGSDDDKSSLPDMSPRADIGCASPSPIYHSQVGNLLTSYLRSSSFVSGQK
jgi:hypothetical protein